MAASTGVRQFCLQHARYARFFATQATHQRHIKAGDPLPNVTLYEGSPSNALKTHDLFAGKKGVIFSVPGAFTPGCSRAHIPEYLKLSDNFRSEGYEEVVCVSVNDPYVMSAWGEYVAAAPKIRMLSDMRCEFTQAINMELDCTPLLGNIRSRRYFLLVEDNTVQHVSHEPDDNGLSCLLCIRRMRQEDVAGATRGLEHKAVTS